MFLQNYYSKTRPARAVVRPQDKQVITNPLDSSAMTRCFIKISGPPNQSGPQVFCPPLAGLVAKLLDLNVLSIGLYTLKTFNNIYILQNHLSCHALKIKSTQIIFKQETFKYNLAQMHSISIDHSIV